jgi:hypothetical protein
MSLAKPPETAAERVKLFEWFGTLGFPDVKPLKFVRFPESMLSGQGGPEKVQFAHGFLLGGSKNEWTVLTFSLKPEHMDKRPQFLANRPADWLSPDDLAAFAKATLAAHAKPGSEEPGFEGWHYSKTTRLFFLAWSCWRQGLDGQAASLFEMVANLRERDLNVAPGIATLRRRIAVDVAEDEFTEAKNALAQVAHPREKVLARLESISKRFPGLETAFVADEMARVLRPMVDEDRAHAKQEKLQQPFAQRSRTEQVAELIFQLRDQRADDDLAMMDMREQRLDLFDGPDESPAWRLFKLGYEAVPQLIDALSNDRFSRTLDTPGHVYSRHHRPRRLDRRRRVRTVGDCALQILERLACRQFYKRKDRLMSEPPSRADAVKKAATVWCDELQRDLQQKGERQVLFDAVQKTSWESVHLCDLLLAKYPDQAFAVMAGAARKATDKIVQRQFIETIDRVKGRPSIDFLSGELRNSPSLSERVIIADVLSRHGRSADGVAVMLDLWQHSPEHPLEDASLVDVPFYLAGWGDVAEVKALGSGLKRRGPFVRLAVVRAFGKYSGGSMSGDHPRFSEVLFHDRYGEEPHGRITPLSKEGTEAVVQLLLPELEDTFVFEEISGSWGDDSFSNPRIADFAGHVLNQIDPKRFPFNLGASPTDRERQREALIKTGRAGARLGHQLRRQSSSPPAK